MDADVFHIESMGPVERAFAEAMHEDCTDGPEHPLSAHSPWRGDEIGQPWSEFTAALARHGLVIALAVPAVTETADLRALIADGIEAFRLTREYVGSDLLPAVEGWSWFDWCERARAALEAVEASDGR